MSDKYTLDNLVNDMKKLPTEDEYHQMTEQFLKQHNIREMFNDICIAADTRLVRLIGFHTDTADYYYRIMDFSGKITLMSCVAPLTSLKGLYQRYDIMEDCFHLNHCPRVLQFEQTFDFENIEW